MLTHADLDELYEWNNAREDITMSGRINGAIDLARSALAPAGMPEEPFDAAAMRDSENSGVRAAMRYADALRSSLAAALRERDDALAKLAEETALDEECERKIRALSTQRKEGHE